MAVTVEPAMVLKAGAGYLVSGVGDNNVNYPAACAGVTYLMK
jgi:hypothetical protein